MSCCSVSRRLVMSLVVTSSTFCPLNSEGESRTVTKSLRPSLATLMTRSCRLFCRSLRAYASRSSSGNSDRKLLPTSSARSKPYTGVTDSLQSRMARVPWSSTNTGFGMFLNIARYLRSLFSSLSSNCLRLEISRHISMAATTSPSALRMGELVTSQWRIAPSASMPDSSLV